MSQITDWSFSKLVSYEECPFRVKLRYIERKPMPELKPGNPLERGQRIHDNLERYVKGECDLGQEAKAISVFQDMLDHMQVLYREERIIVEDDWFFSPDWSICDKEDRCLWVKLDYCGFNEDTATIVIGDWKSGKSSSNTIKNAQQTQLYAVAVAQKFDWVENIITELAYVDEGKIVPFHYSADGALKLMDGFQRRADRMMSDKTFRANPHAQNCYYCPYGPKNGTGACPVGV